MPLYEEYDYRRHLATGDVDLVIGNWLEPPGELHLGRLTSDEVVCLVAEDHPAVRSAGDRGWSIEKYLACEHVAPMPLHPGARGVIDEHLVAQGLSRNIVVRASHFSLIPLMVRRQPAGADDRAAVLLALCRHAAGAHRALPGRRSRR